MAHVFDHARVLESVVDAAQVLDDLDRETHRCVPANVAMHEPDSGIVGVEGNHQEPTAGHHGDVTARWVLEIERRAGTVRARASSQDVEVVPVQMDGVRNRRERRLDDDVDPLSKSRSLNRQGVGGWYGTIEDHVLECWLSVFALEAGARHGPPVDVGGVLRDSESLRLRHAGTADIHGVGGHQACRRLVKAGVSVGVGSSCRDGGRRSTRVADDTLDVLALRDAATRCLHIRTHPVVVHWLVEGDEHLVTLTNVDAEDVGRVGHDRHEVSGYDLHAVAVNVELERRLDGGVHKTKLVCLTLHDVHLEARANVGSGPHVQAVDQASVKRRLAGSCFRSLEHGVDRLVAPILEHDELIARDGRAAWCSARAVDLDGTEDTVVGLDGEMAVVPRRAVVVGGERVLHRLTWCQRTLGDRCNAVHLIGVVLTHTVEMECGAVGCQAVGVVDDDGVTPVGLDHRTRHLTVDVRAQARDPIWRTSGLRDLEIVRDCVAGDRRHIV